MTWLAWRQFRVHTWITAAVLAGLAVVLFVTGRMIADAYTAAGVAGCGTDCADAIRGFLRDVDAGAAGVMYSTSLGVMYLAPVLIGMFWGAPLLAREFEAGTHRLAWNQSVTRTRWLAVKLGFVGAATAAAIGLLSWGVTVWAFDVDDLTGERIGPLVYGARGVVPVGYALFGFALGVTFGLLIRRTVPAMAATFGGYVLAVAAMPLWLRAELAPATHTVTPLDIGKLTDLMMSQDGGMEVIGGAPEKAWVLTNNTLAADGTSFTGPWDPQACGPESVPGTCEDWLATQGLQQELVYHPAGNFWQLQWTETGIFLAAAALLAGFCFWRLATRRS